MDLQLLRFSLWVNEAFLRFYKLDEGEIRIRDQFEWRKEWSWIFIMRLKGGCG
jgi:hypothetical protein